MSQWDSTTKVQTTGRFTDLSGGLHDLSCYLCARVFYWRQESSHFTKGTLMFHQLSFWILHQEDNCSDCELRAEFKGKTCLKTFVVVALSCFFFFLLTGHAQNIDVMMKSNSALNIWSVLCCTSVFSWTSFVVLAPWPVTSVQRFKFNLKI